jgi:uncharacterized membrane protein YhiD involved in acid resistance
MPSELNTIRTALIITLSVLLVLVALRRYRRWVMRRDMPAPLHAELIELHVEYHPARLRVVIAVPRDQVIHTALLDADHVHVHHWADMPLERGDSTVDLTLPTLDDGYYHLEMRTATQRTVRRFRLQQT